MLFLPPALLFLVCDFAESKMFQEHIHGAIAGRYWDDEDDAPYSQVTFPEPPMGG